MRAAPAVPAVGGYGREGARLRRYEARVGPVRSLQRVDTRRADRSTESSRCRSRARSCPTGVDTSYFRSGAPAPDVARRRSYFRPNGPLPNVDGILHFATQIWPRVRASVPGGHAARDRLESDEKCARLRPRCLAFRSPARPTFGLTSATRRPPSRFCASPGESRTRSWKPWRWDPDGRQPEAAGGILAVDGEHFLVGDGPDAFADRVIQLLRTRRCDGRSAKPGDTGSRTSTPGPTHMSILTASWKLPALARSGMAVRADD